MTGEPSAQADVNEQSARHEGGLNPRVPTRARVLLFSDDSAVRDAVRLAVGRRPARDVEVSDWLECATPDAVRAAAGAGGYDLLILDGEANPFGGLGLCRQLKFEIYQCPPVIVLTGRPQDAWLAAWSYADEAVPHPIDPLALAAAVARVARAGVSAQPAGDATAHR